MTKYRALIVDDEPLARERVRALLQTETSVEIVGECGNGPDAIAALRNSVVEILFLDMQMPGCNGLQVLDELSTQNRPAVIFVTAYEEFAVDAFKVQAIDYLLKPFDRERFQLALRRAENHLRTRRAEQLGEKLESLLAEVAESGKKNERLTVKVDGRLVFLKADEIVWVEAADNYVFLHLTTGRLILRETMSALEARLSSKNFARVNRSAIVHLDQIKELQPTLHGDYLVLLQDGTKLPLSRTLRGQLDRFTGEKLG